MSCLFIRNRSRFARPGQMLTGYFISLSFFVQGCAFYLCCDLFHIFVSCFFYYKL